LADPQYTGRVSVPVLWDKETGTIVNNESSDIIRMFNSAFDDITGEHTDYYPAARRPEIDGINKRVYETLNNGVYRCGLATTCQKSLSLRRDHNRSGLAAISDTVSI
jgi:putative glutathione S-transferase